MQKWEKIKILKQICTSFSVICNFAKKIKSWEKLFWTGVINFKVLVRLT